MLYLLDDCIGVIEDRQKRFRRDDINLQSFHLRGVVKKPNLATLRVDPMSGHLRRIPSWNTFVSKCKIMQDIHFSSRIISATQVYIQYTHW